MNVRDLPGKPDFANKRRKFAIFVHGCFWHSHQDCRLASNPKSNRSYWHPRTKTRGQSRHMSSRHREHRGRCDPNEVGRPKRQLKPAPSAVHDNFVERRSRSIYKGAQALALS